MQTKPKVTSRPVNKALLGFIKGVMLILLLSLATSAIVSTSAQRGFWDWSDFVFLAVGSAVAVLACVQMASSLLELWRLRK